MLSEGWTSPRVKADRRSERGEERGAKRVLEFREILSNVVKKGQKGKKRVHNVCPQRAGSGRGKKVAGAIVVVRSGVTSNFVRKKKPRVSRCDWHRADGRSKTGNKGSRYRGGKGIKEKVRAWLEGTQPPGKTAPPVQPLMPKPERGRKGCRDRPEFAKRGRSQGLLSRPMKEEIHVTKKNKKRSEEKKTGCRKKKKKKEGGKRESPRFLRKVKGGVGHDST